MLLPVILLGGWMLRMRHDLSLRMGEMGWVDHDNIICKRSHITAKVFLMDTFDALWRKSWESRDAAASLTIRPCDHFWCMWENYKAIKINPLPSRPGSIAGMEFFIAAIHCVSNKYCCAQTPGDQRHRQCNCSDCPGQRKEDSAGWSLMV